MKLLESLIADRARLAPRLPAGLVQLQEALKQFIEIFKGGLLESRLTASLEAPSIISERRKGLLRNDLAKLPLPLSLRYLQHRTNLLWFNVNRSARGQVSS